MADKKIKVVLTMDGQQYATEIDKATGETKRLSNESDNLAGKTNVLKSRMAKLAIGVGLVAGGIGAAALVFKRYADAVIPVAIEMERLNNQMLAASDNTGEAAANMLFVKSEAERLGLELQSTASAYAKLTAASKGTNLEGEATREIFTAVMEASRTLQLSAYDTEGALRAIEQMMSKGNVQAEELRGQLGERIPGAFQIAARAMGVTTQELNDMLDSGSVLADDLLPKMAVELRNTFGENLETAMDSTDANVNRLKNSFFILASELGEELIPAFNKTLVFTTSLIENFTTLADKIGLIDIEINELSQSASENKLKEVESQIASIENRLSQKRTRGRPQLLKNLTELKKEAVELKKHLDVLNGSNIEFDDTPQRLSGSLSKLDEQSAKLIDKYERQVFALNNVSEAARIRNEIESGSLRGISSQHATRLLQLADEIDQVKALEDAKRNASKAERERLKAEREAKQDALEDERILQQLDIDLKREYEERRKAVERNLETVRRGLATEEELQRAHYDETLAMIDRFYATAEISDSEYIQLKERLMLQHSERMSDIHKKQFDDIDKEGEETFKDLRRAVEGWSRSFADELVESEGNFSDFIGSLLKQIEKLALTKLFEPGFNMLGDLLEGGFGSIFGSGNDPDRFVLSGTSTDPVSNLITHIPLFHSGGLASEGSVSRPDNLANFNNAPRFHQGLMPKEMRAIIHEDEGVFTKGQMKALGKGNVIINITNNSDSKVEKTGESTGPNNEQIIDLEVSNSLGRQKRQGRLENFNKPEVINRG